jgi:pimeloyl-ACP methyl ester carboxylesterase
MLPSFLPDLANNLTEETSVATVKNIQKTSIPLADTSTSIGTTYLTGGKGPKTILLLHGFDSSLLEFRRLFPLLADQYETWAIDLLGFGLSDRSPQLEVSPSSITKHLYNCWKNLINRPVILVGASMGGAAALTFALEYPEVVEKLVLLDSAGMRNGPIIGKYLFPPLDYWAADFLRNPKIRVGISKKAYYDQSFVTADANLCAALHLAMPYWHESLISFTKSGGYPKFGDRLQEIKIPVLNIWGRNDQILGTKDAYLFDKAIPQSELCWIDQCGHVPHLEKSQETATFMQKFINSEIM